MSPLPSSFSVVLLNCCSLYARLAEVKLLLYSCKPSVLCLNETWVTDAFLPTFHGYVSLWCNRGGRGGGVCILVHDSLCYQKLLLSHYRGGVLEVEAIELLLGCGKRFSVLTLYNPNANVSSAEFLHYFDQLSSPFMVAGDFNAHSPLLTSSCVRTDGTGKSLETLLLSAPVSLLNPVDFYTYIDRRTGKCGCLDLFLVSPEVLPYFTLERLRDVGSDHYPLMASSPMVVLHRLCSVAVPRWKLTSAGLDAYSATIAPSSLMSPAPVGDVAADFTLRLRRAASACFSRVTGSGRPRKCSPWWNEACRTAVCDRRRARRALEKHPTRDRLIEYKRCSAVARHCVLQHKRAYRRNFVASITYTTPVGEAWRKLKLLRSSFSSPVYPLEVAGAPVVTTAEKANLFCRTFRDACQAGNIRVPRDLHTTIVASWSLDDSYNCLFTTDELVCALQRVRLTSPGSDGIHNGFLRALRDEHYSGLLHLFNSSFQLGVLPAQWTEGVILPILKPGKVPTSPLSYRPITLLSCLGKLLERLVAARLSFIVERRSFLSPSQCGFRQGFSTIDVLLRLEDRIRAAQAASDVCLVVYIDLQSAFDKIWVDGLLYKLARVGVCGAMARWLHAYLTDRHARVRVNGILSDPLRISAGVPQGGVLSPLLFNLMLMDVPQLDGVDVLLYADDITLCCSGSSVSQAKALMSRYLVLFRDFCLTWGLVVNPAKTVFQYYTLKRINVPTLRYGHRALSYVRHQRILGVIFDAPRLKWGPHIKYLRSDVLRRIDLLKHLASPNWGASQRLLRLFYCAYIRAKLDYGSVLYRTAAPSLLSCLDVLQNTCLRLILGARRTSPTLSLHAEAHLPPLFLRRHYLATKLYVRLLHKPPGNATAAMVCSSRVSALCDGPRLLELFDLPFCRRRPASVDLVPPWSSVSSYVLLDYRQGVTEAAPSALFYDHLDSMYPSYLQVYCDGSRRSDQLSTSCGVYFPHCERAVAWRLNLNFGVLAAELVAIHQALLVIRTLHAPCWVVCSDSLSALQLIQSPTGTCHDLVTPIRSLLFLLNLDRTVRLQWVKAHSGIRGNERADAVARSGHELDRSARIHLPCSDIVALLGRHLFRYWERQWRSDVAFSGKGTHLASLRTDLRPVPWVASRSRRESVVLCRLRLGHVGLAAYLHRFSMVDSPKCSFCGVDETLEHYLLVCSRYRRERRMLVAALQVLDVSPVSVKVLLGGGNFRNGLQYAILNQTAAYLKRTGRLSSL